MKRKISIAGAVIPGQRNIALLNKQQQQSIAGRPGVAGPFCSPANCESYDPQVGCASRPGDGNTYNGPYLSFAINGN